MSRNGSRASATSALLSLAGIGDVFRVDRDTQHALAAGDQDLGVITVPAATRFRVSDIRRDAGMGFVVVFDVVPPLQHGRLEFSNATFTVSDYGGPLWENMQLWSATCGNVKFERNNTPASHFVKAKPQHDRDEP